MEGLKKMIFNYIDKNNITEEELQKLLFAIAKDTAKTKAINYLCWLYLKYEQHTFTTILEDVLQEAVANYYTEPTTAYKETMHYIYTTYTKQVKKDTITSIEDITVACGLNGYKEKHYIKNYTINTSTQEQKEYYDYIIERTEKNLQTKKQVFQSNRQKEQTINKLNKLNILEA